jgi:hypothetical protein
MIADNGTGVAAATASVLAQTNAIIHNGLGADGSLISIGSMDATGNWWGCVDGPGYAGCDAVTTNVNVLPVATAVPDCVSCSVDSDCDDLLACNGVETCAGTCLPGPPIPCPLPSGMDPLCNAPSCIEPGTCVVSQYPDGTPCNTGDDCQAGVCTGPNSLTLGMVRLRPNMSRSQRHSDGRAIVFAQVNDGSTGGTLVANLLAGMVSIEVWDGGNFRTKTVLKGCRKRSNGAVQCHDPTTHTRATFRPVGRFPNIFVMSFSRLHLGTAQTGSGQPGGAVGVILHQDLVDRPSSMAASRCRIRSRSLVCMGA